MMTLFVVTDLSGNILRQGSCSPESVDAQAAEGELAFVLSGYADERTDRIDTQTGAVLENVKTPLSKDDRPARKREIKSAWLEIMQYPVTASDGRVFDFDRDSKELMEGAIVALTATGGTVDWRLLDNTTVSVDATALQAYYDQLKINQAIRGLTVDQEYLAFKASGATHAQLSTWKAGHYPG